MSSFLLLLAGFFLNFKLNSSNEIIIIRQYFGLKDFSIFVPLAMIVLFSINLINNEYFAIKTYEKYKIKELEIRNNLKLGIPNQKEFNVDGELSIFFESKQDYFFFDVEALIYKNGEFIKSNTAEFEISKKNFNLIFHNGERLSLNNEETSKTNFEKFVYSIENRDIEKLYFDKEHFNTIDLINHENLDYQIHGHNRLFQYVLLICIIFISLRIVIHLSAKKRILPLFSFIFFLLLLMQIINSYLIYLSNNNTIEINTYYFFNFINLFLSIFGMYKAIK